MCLWSKDWYSKKRILEMQGMKKNLWEFKTGYMRFQDPFKPHIGIRNIKDSGKIYECPNMILIECLNKEGFKDYLTISASRHLIP